MISHICVIKKTKPELTGAENILVVVRGGGWRVGEAGEWDTKDKLTVPK